MEFSDDELPPAISSAAAGKKPRKGERVRLVAYHNKDAPLVQHRQQVLLEVKDTTSPSTAERSGLDLVAVLDVSGSMGNDKKLDKMKTAMKFVISKLGPMDRLSVVSFSNEAKKWCSLQCMTRVNKEKLIKDVVEDGLKADGRTNMKDGLEIGLKVLAGRRHSAGRVGSIILMSDGDQNEGGNVEDVDTGNVAVYTFGFGAGEFARVLETVAIKSRGGTFSFVRDGGSLSERFSQILAGLLTVVVQDLELTVWDQPGHSEIGEVDAGGYLQQPARNEGTGVMSVTVCFGDLFSGEGRKVIVSLLLPAVGRGYRATTLLFARCRYSILGRGDIYSSGGDFLRCDIRRTGRARPDAVKPEVKAELVRRRYIDTLRMVILITPEEKDLDRAKLKLEEAKRDLDAERSSNNNHPMIQILCYELDLLLKLVVARNWKEFIPFLLSSWTSHYRQRVAGRDHVSTFETPLMTTLKVQAKEFEGKPNMPVSSVEEDIKRVEEEIARERRKRAPEGHNRWRRWQRRIWEEQQELTRSCSGWAWRVLIFLCTVLAVAVIITGVAVFAVFLLYKPKMPALVVSDARLSDLQYGQDDGAVRYLQASITILAENNNSKADASFSVVDLALGFHGADVALLRAEPFVVARRSALPLRYNVESAAQALDPAGMRAMDEALRDGVVPLDLFGKARTRWKVGVFVHVKFWTRINCRLRFFFPGNGTAMPADRQKCRSRSP